MGKRTYYAYHGAKLPLRSVLPGVRVHVLGPPTLAQSDAIDRQRSDDPDEFWQLQATAASHGRAEPLSFPGFAESRNPVWARWIRRRLRRARGEQLLSIVRSLDHAMNNTSLILLFETGGKKLLFPGDAQLENWMYAIGDPADSRRKRAVARTRRLLAGVDVYKVGHHGSRNATPRTLYSSFTKKRATRSDPALLHTLLSTLPDVHGSEGTKTEVPRRSLVRTLKRDTDLTTTTDFAEEEISRTLKVEL